MELLFFAHYFRHDYYYILPQYSFVLTLFFHYFIFIRVKALPLIDAEKRTPYLTDLTYIHNQAANLLQNPSMYKVIEHILQRESRWIDWKNAACPAFERFPAEVKVGGECVVEYG
ncbi:hypothetical protein EON65_29955 [archaeon]|nr:MAG: hypothetical protein EON65_29955 [archaeon]